MSSPRHSDLPPSFFDALRGSPRSLDDWEASLGLQLRPDATDAERMARIAERIDLGPRPTFAGEPLPVPFQVTRPYDRASMQQVLERIRHEEEALTPQERTERAMNAARSAARAALARYGRPWSTNATDRLLEPRCADLPAT